MHDKHILEYKMANIFEISNTDFILRTDLHNYEKNVFDLNKDCEIFNKFYDITEREKKGSIEIQIDKDVIISDCIKNFNKHLKWLNSDNCKNELIEKFCEFVNGYSERKLTKEEIGRNKWYENLEINSVLVTIPIDSDKINFCIGCVDNWHILYVAIEGDKILSLDDKYVDLENGVGYNGIWEK